MRTEAGDSETTECAPHRVAQRLSVAPMMDWTDRHCRAFHRVLAPGALVYTEMLHAQAVLQGDRQRLLGFDDSEHPVALQLGGSDPEVLVQAARIGADWGYDEVNLNVGCPSDRVQAGRFGACLMKEPSIVAECIAAMTAAVAIPVTVKCRLGVDEQEGYDCFLHFIDTVAATGCTRFVVHARKAWLSGLSPKDNREIPPLRYEWVYRLKAERPQLQVTINGGIDNVEAALAHLEKVDAVMLGRCAYHEPYRLHLLDCALSGRAPRSREQLMRDYMPYIEAALERGTALKHISRHILGLFHGRPGGRVFRQVISECAPRSGAGVEVIEDALQYVGMEAA